MIRTIDVNDFIDAFREMGRAEQFSYAAKRALFEYYEEIDPAWELDVIAICCDWVEYDADELVAEYGSEEGSEDLDDVIERCEYDSQIIRVRDGRKTTYLVS